MSRQIIFGGIYFFMAKQFSLNRNEKLKGSKQLDELFVNGKSFLVFPVKTVFLLTDTVEKPAVKMGVGVSKKNFKLAVNRNRIKRLLREAYRVNKLPLIDVANEKKKNISVFFLYVDKEMIEYNKLNDKVKTAVNKLIQLL